MKKRLLSIVLMLALAFTLAIGTAVVSSAADGDASLGLKLEENITVQLEFEGYATTAKSATYAIGAQSTKNAIIVVKGDNAVVEIPVPVKDFDTSIVVTVYDENDEVLKEKTVSAAQYRALLEQQADSYAIYGDLLAALEGYSAAAKNYFAKNEAAVAPDTAPDFGESEMVISGTIPTGLTHYSATLLLESETTIRHYFILEDGKDISSYRFWVDLDEDGGYDKDEDIQPFVNGSYYCVDISGITPNDIDKQFTVFVTDFTNTYSCTYGALDYAARAYNKVGAANYVKALAAALNDYRAEAAKIGANIIFMDSDKATQLNTQLYNYGVDNYISYAPTKDGSLFGGWVDADGNKVNVIPAGSTGDVTLYAQWISAPIFSASDTMFMVNRNSQTANYWKAHDHVDVAADGTCDVCSHLATCTVDMSAAFEGSADQTTCSVCGIAYAASTTVLKDAKLSNYPSVIVTKTADYVELDFASFQMPNSIVLPTVNYTNFAPAYTSVAGDYKYAMATMEFGKVEGKAVMPFTMRILQESQFFNIAADGAVYLGASQDATYKIAQLEDGVLTPVTFYMDLTGCDFTHANSGNLTACNAQTAVLHATNVNGDAVSVTCTGKWYTNRGGIGQMFWDPTHYTDVVGKECGIMIGEWSWTAVPAMNDTFVVDASTGDVLSSYNGGDAARLPMDTYNEGYTLAGWYADEALTQPINSIPAGNFGSVEVYGKWISAYNSAANVAGVNAQFHETNTNYGDLISKSGMCYTYSVAFDKTSSATASGQIRLRNSGLEPLFDENGNVTGYKDWAGYYRRIYTDPSHDWYVGDVFDGILKDLGIELRAKDVDGNYVYYTVVETVESEVTDEETGATTTVTEEVEKQYHEIDDAAWEEYMYGINLYNPNSNITNALRYNNGVIKTMNNVILANALTEDIIITFVFDFANTELRYYVNNEYVLTEQLSVRDDSVPVDGKHPCNVFFDKNGGLLNYAYYNSAENFALVNWQNTTGVKHSSVTFTFGDIYAPVNVNYELDGGAINDAEYDKVAYPGCSNIDLPADVTKENARFIGWYIDEALTVKADKIVVETAKDITLYAKFVDKQTIVYNANGGTITSTGYTESFFPGYTEVVLPNMVSNGNMLFVGWYMDADYTVKATSELINAKEETVNLYAKFVSNTVVQTINASIDNDDAHQVSATAMDLETGYLSASADKAVTMRLVLEKVEDPSAIVNSVVQMRVRDNLGKNLVQPIYVQNGVFYAGHGTSGMVLASNRSDREVIIDIVMDFDAKSLTYYVDYEKVHTASAAFGALEAGLYDYSAAPTYKSFWQWDTAKGNLHHTVSIIYGDIHHLDTNSDHLCDDCGLTVSDCVDIAGDGDHNCDMCGAANTSECVDENTDAACDECGNPMSVPEITYEVNGGTISTVGYSTKIFPNTEVVLPWATKSGESFVAWYLDAELTQKASAEALAAFTEDVTLYAKYATPLGSGTVTGHGTAITLKDYSTMWANDASLGYSVTHRIVLNNATEGNEIRCRNQVNANYVQEVWLCADGVYATKNGVKVGDFGDIVDIVMDFDDKTISYYCNGVLVEEATRTGIAFADVTTYDFITNSGYVFCQFNRQDSSGATNFTYETFAGNING